MTNLGKMVERQRRWFELDERGVPTRDAHGRFIASAFNPLPQLSPQDKLMQRAYLDGCGVPQPELIAIIHAPEELLQLTLPPSWVLKPVGAAYSEGVVLAQ